MSAHGLLRPDLRLYGPDRASVHLQDMVIGLARKFLLDVAPAAQMAAAFFAGDYLGWVLVFPANDVQVNSPALRTFK